MKSRCYKYIDTNIVTRLHIYLCRRQVFHDKPLRDNVRAEREVFPPDP